MLLLQLCRLLCVHDDVFPERLCALLEFSPYFLCFTLVPEGHLCEFLLVFFAGSALCFFYGCFNEFLDGSRRGLRDWLLYRLREWWVSRQGLSCVHVCYFTLFLACVTVGLRRVRLVGQVGEPPCRRRWLVAVWLLAIYPGCWFPGGADWCRCTVLLSLCLAVHAMMWAGRGGVGGERGRCVVLGPVLVRRRFCLQCWAGFSGGGRRVLGRRWGCWWV